MYTGTSPIIEATANAPAKNKKDLLLLVISAPMFFFSPALFNGILGFVLNNNNSLFISENASFIFLKISFCIL